MTSRYSHDTPSRRFYHGTLVSALPSILKNGLKVSSGWGGAGTEGVYLSGSVGGAKYWAKLAYQREHDDRLEADRFDRKFPGKKADKVIAVLAIDIPEKFLKNLRADMEQAEDVGFEGDESDWEASLVEIGDVRYIGPVPPTWIEKLS